MRDKIEEKYSQDEVIKLLVEDAKNLEAEGKLHFEWKHITERDGYESTMFLIPNLNIRGLQGDIRIFVSESFSDIKNSIEYNLIISYSDWLNDQMRQNNRINDL